MDMLDTAAEPVRPASTVGSGARLPSLTGLRFLAALMVFGVHVSISGLLAPSSVQHAYARLVGAGAVGVEFFFILSGFVLTWSARPTDTARAFWRRRAVKIYPVYLVTLAVAIIGLVAMSLPAGPSVVLPNVALVQSWFPSPSIHFGANSVSWSLADEAFFYALFPWVLPVLARIRPERLWAAATGCAVAVFAVPVLALPLPQDIHYWFVYVFPPVRMLEFVLGMLVALIVQAGRWPRIPVWVAATALVVAYAVTPYAPVDMETSAVTLVPFALLIPAVAVADISGRRSFWSSPSIVWLGEISFAFYLIHQSVILDMMRGLGMEGSSPIAGGILALIALGISVGLAANLHLYVEVPLMRRYSRAQHGRHRQEEPSTLA